MILYRVQYNVNDAIHYVLADSAFEALKKSARELVASSIDYEQELRVEVFSIVEYDRVIT